MRLDETDNLLIECFTVTRLESQVIVADVTNDWRVMETPWDLVLELSREQFEIEQICEWLKCAPR